MQAKKSLSSISANRDLWIEQYRQEIAERDRRSGLSAMLNKGLQEGLQKGIQQGIQQGRTESLIETAKRLIQMGLSPQQVSTGTSLSMEEVLRLFNEK